MIIDYSKYNKNFKHNTDSDDDDDDDDDMIKEELQNTSQEGGYRSVLNKQCPHCGYSLIPFKVDCYDGIVDGSFCCGMNCNYVSIPKIKVYKNVLYDNTLPVYTIHEQNSRITCNNEQLIKYIQEGSRQITEQQLLKKLDKDTTTTTNKEDDKFYYTLSLDNIIGYKSIKRTLRNIVNIPKGKKKIHMIIAGAAGTAKTVFLKELQKELLEQKARLRYIDCSMMSKSGLFDTLFDMEEVDFLLMDEIDKLEKEHQSGLLNMAETGILQQMTARNNREKTVNDMTIIATGNFLEKVIEPLRTRFLTFYIKAYTKKEYLEICELMLQKKYKDYITQELARHIAIESFTNIKPPNMRDADRIARMIRDNPTIEYINNVINDIVNHAIPEDVLSKLDKQT